MDRMNSMRPGGLLALLALVLLTACATPGRDLVVLIPDPDGSVGEATITNDAGTVSLDEANQATAIQDRTTAPETPAPMAPAEIDAIFSEALAIQPRPPVHFVLYFETNSTDLTPESRDRLKAVLEAVRDRASVDISVIGHADTSGDAAHNLELSERRAQAVSELLAREGVAESSMEVTSHGENNPLIPTGDDVDEPRNRRVEVVVR